MSVSSQFDAQPALLERRYLTIKAGLAQKLFWDLKGRKGLLADESLSADQTTSGIGPPSERIVTVCIG
jgi:hypothetical protein